MRAPTGGQSGFVWLLKYDWVRVLVLRSIKTTQGWAVVNEHKEGGARGDIFLKVPLSKGLMFGCCVETRMTRPQGPEGEVEVLNTLFYLEDKDFGIGTLPGRVPSRVRCRYLYTHVVTQYFLIREEPVDQCCIASKVCCQCIESNIVYY